jgi:hypothetical protein
MTLRNVLWSNDMRRAGGHQMTVSGGNSEKLSRELSQNQNCSVRGSKECIGALVDKIF